MLNIGSADVCTEVSTKTTFLTDEELKHMVLKVKMKYTV